MFSVAEIHNLTWHWSFLLFTMSEISWNIFYRLPTKLQKGNVFSRVCHSVRMGVWEGCPMWLLPMIHWTSPFRNLTGQGPPTLVMFKLVQLLLHCTGTPRTYPPGHVSQVSLWTLALWQDSDWWPDVDLLRQAPLVHVAKPYSYIGVGSAWHCQKGGSPCSTLYCDPH